MKGLIKLTLIGLCLVAFCAKDSMAQSTSTSKVVVDSMFNKGNIHSTYELIEGLFPGLLINKEGANRNESFNLRIRGVGTFLGRLQPLIVIDGVIGAPIEALDPNDVHSVRLVRGAETAKYGIQGAQGVLEITSKLINTDGSRITVNSFVGVDSKIHDQKVLDRQAFLAMGGNDLGDSKDWMEEITQTGISSATNVSVFGSQNNLQYRVSANLRLLDGILRNTGFERTNISGSLNWKIRDNVALTYSGAWLNEDADLGFAEAFRQAYKVNPTMPSYFQSGDLYQGIFFDLYNPIGIVELVGNTRNRSQFYQSAELTIGLKGFDLFARGGLSTNKNTFLESFDDRFFYRQNEREAGITRSTTENYGVGIKSHPIVKGKWQMSFSGGVDMQSFETSSFSQNYSPLSDAIRRDSSDINIDLLALHAGVSAKYGDWVYLDVANRYEKSNVLTGDKGGNFYSISGLFDIGTKLQMPSGLTVRLSRGVSGLTPYTNDINSTDPAEVGRTQLDVHDFTFEKSTNSEINVQFVPSNGKWSLEATRYQRKATDLLGLENYIFEEFYWKNTASLNNSGWEFNLGFNVTDSLFNFRSNLIVNTLQTEWQDVPYDNVEYGSFIGCGCSANRYVGLQNGQPYGSFYVYVFDGLDDRNFMVFRDTNNDGTVDATDRTNLGQSMPKVWINWRNQISYKNSQLTILLESAFGHSLHNSLTPNHGANYILSNTLNLLEDRVDVDTHTPRYSDVYVEEGNYIRLKNISFTQKFRFKGIPINAYVAANNLLTFSNYSGNDPSFRLSDSGAFFNPGVQTTREWLPARSYALGLNISF